MDRRKGRGGFDGWHFGRGRGSRSVGGPAGGLGGRTGTGGRSRRRDLGGRLGAHLAAGRELNPAGTNGWIDGRSNGGTGGRLMGGLAGGWPGRGNMAAGGDRREGGGTGGR